MPLFAIAFLDFGLIDAIDILLVGFLIYQLYKLMRGSVAVKIFLGLLSIYLFYLVVKAAEMELLSSILGQFIGVGVIASVVLFQQEIRQFLLMIGRSTVMNNEKLLKALHIYKNTVDEEELSSRLNSVVKAADELGKSRTGALIVFARTDSLNSFVESGDLINAIISKRLLLTIFQKQSPMHDGAVIIGEGHIRAARCIIPVTQQENLPAYFGLRHRAAIGLTEASDALVLIVSEETGYMSLAYEGLIDHNLSTAELRTKLVSQLTVNS